MERRRLPTKDKAPNSLMGGRRLPFRGLGPREWRNLGLATLLALYAVYIGLRLYWRLQIGADYLAFWSAGRVANTEGYAHVYDLDAIRRVQEPLIPKPDDPNLVFMPISVLFLPVFILPFQVLAVLPAGWGLLIWTVFNVLLFLLYLRFFGKQGEAKGLPEAADRLPVMMLLSFPVFWNLHWGQVNILLLVCVGEFLRAMVTGKPFRAGLWLGGLWLKPQTLVLIVPALLLQRSWRALAGFAAASAAVWAASLGLDGIEAMRRLVGLWLGSASVSGISVTNPENMSNWRMVGINLSALIGARAGWGIAGLGLALTALVALSFWLRRVSPRSPEFGIALLGTMAATCAATWHSHMYMMVILIPPLLYLWHRCRLTAGDLDLWLFLMPALVFVGFVLDLIRDSGILPPIFPKGLTAIGFAADVGGFGLNLYFVVWSARHLYGKRG